MTPEEQDRLIAERAVLQQDVATLAQQVKLLVKAEHAVTRSRRDLDRQLKRIRRLAEFSLNITGVEDPKEVLAQARDALFDLFELDDVVALTQDDGRQWPADFAFAGPEVSEPEAPRAARLLELAAERAATPPPLASAPRLVMWVPLGARTDGVAAVLLAWTSRLNAHHRDVPRADHVPFLALFSNHVTRALDNALLTAELRQSNLRLQASLQDLERTQAQLVQAQKLQALGRLAGGIAHDFNNLLTLIVGHAELLRPALEGHAEGREDLAMILDATKRASEITRRLLAFGRKQEHKQELVDLNALTMDMSRMLRRLIGDDVMLQLDLDTSIGRVRADTVQIEQILMNLVVNARDAMPGGGKLIIETRHARQSDAPEVTTPTTNMVALTVVDNGVGMDDATRRQLFEPFFTTKPVGKGTGLGLATVYGLVEQNGGHIAVSSDPGRGSRFTVLLRLADGPSVAELGRPSTSRGSVMIVEDEDGIRRMVSRVLRRNGYEVCEARDGYEALDVAKRLLSLDLLVTDVIMPAMGGPELVGRLRRIRPGLPVIFMSGHTFDCLDQHPIDADLDCFLPKPFAPDKLMDTVASMLGTARSVRAPLRMEVGTRR